MGEGEGRKVGKRRETNGEGEWRRGEGEKGERKGGWRRENNTPCSPLIRAITNFMLTQTTRFQIKTYNVTDFNKRYVSVNIFGGK